MAYEVTANRRRPQSFEQLAGQEFVSSTLRNSVASGSIAHAYLFSGPRGCGKTTTARLLAKALNCRQGPTADPCGSCDSCLEIGRGASLDVIEIDGASNTSVDNVRQIRDEVLFPPNSGRYKVYIIDEVHMLSNSAFNALLKTIEEPPPYVVFIFATTEVHKVPATIKSRCQQFAFRLLPAEILRRLLSEALAETGGQADEEALFWIAKEAGGSARDAYTLLDQAMAFSGGRLSLAAIKEKLGVAGLDELNLLMEACAAGRAGEAYGVMDELLGKGVSCDQLGHGLAEYMRAILLVKAGVTRDGILGYPRERFSAEVLSRLDREQMERGLALCMEALRQARHSPNPRFELELAVSRLCGLSESIGPARARAEIAAIKAALTGASFEAGGSPIAAETRGTGHVRSSAAQPAGWEGRPATDVTSAEPTAAQSPAPAVAPGVDQSKPDLVTLRTAVIQAFRKTRVMLAAGLEKSSPWFIQAGRLVLPFNSRWEADIVGQDARAIAERIQALSGAGWELEFRAPSAAPQKSDEPAKGEGDEAGRRVGENGEEGNTPDPVKSIERMFRGSVVGERDLGGRE
jgi:DNA polymerase-3 subunit gamma/tau